MDEAEKEIREIIEAYAGLPTRDGPLTVDENLFDLGMNSYAMVNVMLALEESFGIEIPVELFREETFESVRSLQTTVCVLRPETDALRRPRAIPS